MIPLFLQTQDNIIWFAFNRINDNYICIPKKIGDYKGKNYSEWYDNSKCQLNKYKKRIEGLGENGYVVNENYIIKKYDSLKFVKEKKYLALKYNLNKYVETIINDIHDFFNISFNDIGIEGSILLDCYTQDSDIDILIFGIDNAKKIQKEFNNFQNHDDIVLYDLRMSREYVEKRKNCGYGNNETLLIKQFSRRYYGFVNGKQFSIVCVPYEFQDGYIDLNRIIKFDGIFEGLLKVIDDDKSCIIPSVYIGIDENGKNYIIEIFNHYGINQVKKNEKVFVRGKKYVDCYNNKSIIILSFWSKVKERFDLYE